ncbi:multifunctional oxoglutarate decarboxylase/oxoglutarate dehydrogenase thiamine pyrophosphate-binding subunit/dihydrolipoyllysine-residue succinyltransferase subunit [Naumannella cuiyingiana]|uniref:multifunctional oxoglutarate decarboxylase/oxoglutarate dehydrogenase thiamine pyrophosphate-binding subunit/dihydrolipoyllysine-residue succinyltransferase subunit n=1 Tax=Naumannella cuiyingiana TaxID=1347891 RepID=UPI0015CC48AB|nr:multifunctional oxoglutarate decarboxylase/oxoglutarate dehydrogenase thiamine pyrophosphate-binding subunit/dihydrolipoyllysine-residue succinyltransferase subunit [Naumannella cuiyingiana]
MTQPWKKAIVATAPDQKTTEAVDEFGANDWLAEEMYERYSADPTSVDKQWQDFFAARAGANGAPTGSASAKQPAAEPATPKKKPAPKTAAAPTEQQAPAATNAPATNAPATTNGSAKPKARVEPPNTVREPRPAKPGTPGGVPADPPNPTVREASEAKESSQVALRGAAARAVKNMDASLTVPTATSVRAIPMKLITDQRVVINNHLRRARGGKVSFTHILGWALVKAAQQVPAMNNAFAEADGKPMLVEPAHINLGLAIDLPGKDGNRQLLVPSIKGTEQLDFAQFWAAYETLVKKARDGKLTLEDFQGTTITLTNPGTIGTNHSVPRLMNGQGAIIGVGSIGYPPEYAGTDPERLNDLGVSKILTLTSTYDHRIIQGAVSGEFLAQMERILLSDEFYDEIFASLRIPYEPIRWAPDRSAHHEDQVSKQARVFELINAYRSRGHLMADTDPVEYRMRNHPDLDVQTHGLTLWDLDREFATGSFGGPSRPLMKLRDILGVLRDSYCRQIGIEYMYIADPEQRRWIQDRVEKPHESLPREEHLRVLDKLNEAEVFEHFLQTKYVGQKRFSLEGSESTIVMLDEICEQAAMDGLDEVAIGMPHRGRLNVLANVVGKSYGQIFREFEGNIDPRSVQGSGDVKYHLGAEGHFTALDGSTIKTSVAANPSHLEAVDPVLEGIARAKQDILDKGTDFPVLPLLMHGDAAFAGQGVVMEVLQMSQLRGYRTGGTIHLVVNNQVGFTTSPTESRSSLYSTDVAKTIQAPVFHVNGDDPEAVVRVARLAFDFRKAFNKDVVIDLISYRRRGHNEGDDPSFTQPLMYDLIENKRSVRKLYAEALVGRGEISIEDAEAAMKRFQKRLEEVFSEVREGGSVPEDEPEYRRVPNYPKKAGSNLGTSVDASVLQTIAEAHTNVPDGFTVHPKVDPQLKRRAKAMVEGPIDWASAELLAFGSLLLEGRPVRLTGQDSRRGTFTQRFAAVIDRRNGDAWVPLRNMAEDQGKFMIFDSPLSEYGVMGFEYGYSVARPEALVLWEAQFGDFVNGGQIISDEFFAAGEAKWGQKSGVVLLLPHGYEGQGPDHSSARLERWLQLAAEDAFRIAQPSTPASYFHLLRDQAFADAHRPLVVATPKSMLRNKLATSQPSDFTDNTWKPVLTDQTITDPSKVSRVLLCSGKVRWDLVKAREKAGLEGEVAIIALEQLYPLPTDGIVEALAPYSQVTDFRWVQDEPENQGPWPFIALHLAEKVAASGELPKVRLQKVTRPASSAPAVGVHKASDDQSKDLMRRALEA